MSYNTALQANNTDLQAILDTVNSLPDKVEGPTYETVQFYIHSIFPITRVVYTTVLDDGTISTVDTTSYDTINGVYAIVGSLVYFGSTSDATGSSAGCTMLFPSDGTTYTTGFVFQMPATNEGSSVHAYTDN